MPDADAAWPHFLFIFMATVAACLLAVYISPLVHSVSLQDPQSPY